MAVNLNDFTALNQKLSSEKQVENAERQLKTDIKQEERRRQEAYDKAAREARRSSMGPLTALMRGDFERFGTALIEEDPVVMLAKGNFSGAVNKFVDMNQEAGTVALNTVGQVAAGLGPTIAAAINTGVDSAQRAANEAAGSAGHGDTSMSVQDQADLAKTVADPNASAEAKAAAGARLLANAASFIPAAGAGASAAQKLLLEGSKAALQAAPEAVHAAQTAAHGDLLGAGLQGAALASHVAGAAAPGGGGAERNIGLRDLARAGAGAAGGIASFTQTGNLDNLVNALSGTATGLLDQAGKSEVSTGINYATSTLTGNADKVIARVAGTAAGNALRDGVQESPLGTGDTRFKPGEDTYAVEIEGVPQLFKSKEEAEQFAAAHARTVPDLAGEAAWNTQQDEDAARALQDFMDSQPYRNLPENLKAPAVEMFKGQGGTLTYPVENPERLSPLQRTLEGKTFGEGDQAVGILRGGKGARDTDIGRIFGGDAAALENARKGLEAQEETYVKRYNDALQHEYNSLIGTYVSPEGGSAAEFQKRMTGYNRAVQEAQAQGGAVAMPDGLKALKEQTWHFPAPTEEQSLEITPYRRAAYTGTKTVPLEVRVQAGAPVDTTVTPGPVTPDRVPDPIAPEPQQAEFNPEYGWHYTGADYSGGNQSIGFQEQEAYTPEAMAAAAPEEETHNWSEYITAMYGSPLVYSDEQMKVKYFTVAKGKRLREAFKALNRRITSHT